MNTDSGSIKDGLNRQKHTHKIQLTFVDRFQLTLLCSYLAIAGIYWLPGISHILLAQFKLMAYSVLVIIGLFRITKLQRDSLWIVAGLGCCGILAFFANAINDDLSGATDYLLGFTEPMLWLIALYGVRHQAHQSLLLGMLIAMTLFFVASLYPMAAALGIAPVLLAPDDFLDVSSFRDEFYDQITGVIGGGFAGQATTWGVIVPVAALMTISLYYHMQFKAYALFAALVLHGSIVSIMVSSARGGSITLIAMGLYQIMSNKRIAFVARISIVISAALLSFVVVVNLIPENFFRGFDASGSFLEIADQASTGRVGSWLFALEKFMESPVFGVGAHGAYYGMIQIHNTYLKILAESGLIVFIIAAAISFRVLIISITNKPVALKEATCTAVNWPDTSPVIIAGIVLALVEPNTIFGNFNASAVFWTAVWMALIARSQLGGLKK